MRARLCGNTRTVVFLIGVLVLCLPSARGEDPTGLRDHFVTPPDDCRPQTRWWWMGNAVTKEEISRQLRQMHDQGLRGVEQISMEPVYEKGSVPYLSDAYFDLLKHVVAEARTLGMSVSLNFGGPGWVWGGDWIPREERNATLVASSLLLTGPTSVVMPLPTDAALSSYPADPTLRTIPPDYQLLAVVAGRVREGVLDPQSFQVLTDRLRDRRLPWQVPEGTWRVMAFWTSTLDNSVNHLDAKAMRHYVDYLGKKYSDALGDALGTTVESLFGDSFEVPRYRNGLYWCDSFPQEFRARKGYDLISYLPALWWEVGPLTPKIRYDVNEVLHQLAMEAFFGTFGEWCRAHGIRSRVQPYGFVSDNLEGAGAVDIPEMEVTAGEKDAVPWFDPRISPREYVASGAHLAGRNVVSVEAYTYLHWEPYRATLEELKIASDIFLRSGANRFMNHGFLASPESDITPTRGFFPAIHISPDNVWWRYYHHLSDYLGRCCYLLRQGSYCADVAIYSPLANQWTLDVLNARRWSRDFEWGELSRLLISNGYAYDLVNDDTLQHHASFDKTALHLGAMTYRVLILPNITALPLETLRSVEAYVHQGGTVVALERVPEASCGLANWQDADREVREIVARLFTAPAGREDVGRQTLGQGTTYWINQVFDRREFLDRHSSSFDPFLNAIRRHVAPDMAIDFEREGLRNNEGLCFLHRRQESRDIYFVANVQDRPIDWLVGFRVDKAVPWRWDPNTGQIAETFEYQERDGSTVLPLRLRPYGSTLLVFEKSPPRPHVVATSLAKIEQVEDRRVAGWTDREGDHFATLESGEVCRATVHQLPAPLRVANSWHMVLESPHFARLEQRLDTLVSWTDLPAARHFSGTGVYTTDFELPDAYLRNDLELPLDLGVVGNVAEVRLNGQPVGTTWMRGQPLELSGVARAGRNRLEISVTNTLINRVSGWTTFPDVPQELQPRLGHGLPEGQAMRLLGFSPLPRSGLLGPVEIHPYQRLELSQPPRKP